MPRFHHHRLPEYSTLLAGRQPPTEVGFASEQLQIWYNNTEQTWADPGATRAPAQRRVLHCAAGFRCSSRWRASVR